MEAYFYEDTGTPSERPADWLIGKWSTPFGPAGLTIESFSIEVTPEALYGPRCAPYKVSDERFCGGAGEVAGFAIKGEADEVDLFAAMTIRLGVALFLDLGEGLLGCAVDFELKDEDAFRRLGNEVCAAMGLPILGSDAEKAARGWGRKRPQRTENRERRTERAASARWARPLFKPSSL